MLFGRRNKKYQPSDRVLDLKARVDALRQADVASRKRAEPYSLDHFLEGDDVLTGREVEDTYEPSGFAPDEPPSEAAVEESYGTNGDVDLEAELRKYLQRQEELDLNEDRKPSALPQRLRPPEPENTSLLLDGTWSRDEVPSPRASSWPNGEPSSSGSSSSQVPALDSNLAWPRAIDDEWWETKHESEDEEWPSGDQAL